MTKITHSTKACTVNPLKMSQPLGGALAFMGVRNLHAAAARFAGLHVVRAGAVRPPLPRSDPAADHRDERSRHRARRLRECRAGDLNIAGRTKPAIIGICSTGVTETKGDDVDGFIRVIRSKHPELADIALVYVSTPGFQGRVRGRLVEGDNQAGRDAGDQAGSGTARRPARINVLPGSHLTPGDLDELRDIIEAFGLKPTFLPDISGSLDGHVPEEFTPTTLGGISVAADRLDGTGDAHARDRRADAARRARRCSSRPGSATRCSTGSPGSRPTTSSWRAWRELSGRPVPAKYRRQRSQLVDAMLDGHFYFGGKSVAIGAEPDLLLDYRLLARRDGLPHHGGGHHHDLAGCWSRCPATRC